MLLARTLLLVPLAVLSVIGYIWATHWYMCHMEAELKPFLLNLRREFEHAGIPLILEGGTLLGAVREGGIIATEMDIDVAIFHEDLGAATRLREPLLAKYGYHLYDQNDYIFQKALHRLYAFEWEPYLNDFPCLRVYDSNKWWYADVFCYTRITRSQLWPALDEGLPPGFRNTHNTHRALVSVYPNVDDKGAVLWEDYVRPLGQLLMWGERFNVPAQPERILEVLYGKDWRTPRGKGIRIAYCNNYLWAVVLAAILGAWAVVFRRIVHPHPTHMLSRSRAASNPKEKIMV